MGTIHVQRPEEISGLLDYVHDCAFELDAVKFDAEKKVLTLPVEVRISKPGKVLGIAIKKKVKAKVMLHIRNVTGWRVSEDKARIGYGDINRILVQEGSLLIEGALPVSVQVDITGLDLELVVPDEMCFA